MSGIPIKSVLFAFLLVASSSATAKASSSGIPLVLVKGGEFQRGGPVPCTESKGAESCEPLIISDEQPRHRVEIDDFYLCKTEVTRVQWAQVMGEPLPPVEVQKLPKTGISWLEAQVFLEALSRLDGHVYRLPTEAEWEYASQNVKQSHLDKEAWYRRNSKGTIQQVAGLKPNSFGLFDMLGNVWEWTSDWYGEDYYKESPTRNPQGPAVGERRVVRGGAYNSVASYVRVGTRMGFGPNTMSRFTGFRCARSIKK